MTEQVVHLLDGRGDSHRRRIDHQVRVVGLLVRAGDAGELRDLAGASPGIETLAITPLALLEWGGYVDEDEVAVLADHLADLASRLGERRDGRAHRDPAVPRNLSGDEADPADVQVAIGARESEARGKQMPNDVAVQQRDGSAPVLDERLDESASDGRFARTRQPGKHDRETATGPRWAEPPPGGQGRFRQRIQ